MTTIKEIEQIMAKCTTSNYTNNTNNTNDTNDTNNIVTNKQLHGEQLVSTTPPLASSGVGVAKSQTAAHEDDIVLFPTWKWLKADLFENETRTGKHHKKLALSILKHEEDEPIRMRAAFNSPFRCFKRGVADYETAEHYQLCVRRYHQLKDRYKYVWISKFYQNRGVTLPKPVSVKYTSGLLYIANNNWCLDLVYDDHCIEIPLTDECGHWKNKSIIASRKVGLSSPNGSHMIDGRDLLG